MPPGVRPKWQQAYDAQMGLWRWYRTPDAGRFMAGYYKTHQDAFRDQKPGSLLRQMCQSELGRLIDCDPIFVSDEMCEVVNAAKDTFKPEPLLETDLITPRGFLFFETPFEIPDRFDRPTTVAAVSWVMQYAFEEDLSNEQLAELNEMRSRDFGTEHGLDDLEETLRVWGGSIAGIALTIYAANRAGTVDELLIPGAPDLLPMHLTPWYFGMTFDGNEVDLEGEPTGAEWWWRIVQTTFRLMQQQIAARRRELPPRASRHEARKTGFYEREIVVVRLRREKGEHHETMGEANYSHRFIVGGHWRNQPYPSLGITRLIWISPYVKGSAELPLIVRPRRVFQWDH